MCVDRVCLRFDTGADLNLLVIPNDRPDLLQQLDLAKVPEGSQPIVCSSVFGEERNVIGFGMFVVPYPDGRRTAVIGAAVCQQAPGNKPLDHCRFLLTDKKNQQFPSLQNLQRLADHGGRHLTDVFNVQRNFSRMEVGRTSILENIFHHSVQNHPQLFDGSLPTYDGKHRVGLRVVENAKPHYAEYARTRRLEGPQYKALLEWLEKGLRSGLVVEMRTAKWAAPVVVAPKPNGKWRICANYIRLNQVTEPISGPCPRTDECLEKLGSHRYFGLIDLEQGFNIMPVVPEARQYLGFIVPGRTTYTMTRCPFGIRNAPAQFMTMMNDEFREFLEEGWLLVFVDDLMILADTTQELDDRVRRLLQRAAALGLRVAPHKMRIGMPKFEYLGHTVTPEGLTIPRDRVEKLLEANLPRNKSELRRFIGLLSYYRRFIHGFAKIAAPLNDLLQEKSQYAWDWQPGSPQLQAYHTLVSRLKDDVCLAKVDLAKPFVVATDASSEAVGLVIKQLDEKLGKERPVLFDGAKLKPGQKCWSPSERECYAIIWALTKYRHMINNGHPITVVTDHKPLEYLQSSEKKPPAIERLMQWIIDLPIKIKWVAGEKMGDADFFSRAQVLQEVREPAELLDSMSDEQRCLSICNIDLQQRRTVAYAARQFASHKGMPLLRTRSRQMEWDPWVREDGVSDAFSVGRSFSPEADDLFTPITREEPTWEGQNLFDAIVEHGKYWKSKTEAQARVAESQSLDPTLQHIRRCRESNTPLDAKLLDADGWWKRIPHQAWRLADDGSVWAGDHMAVPQSSVARLLHAAHTLDFDAHRSAKQMEPWLHGFTWPSKTADIKRFVDACPSPCALVQEQRRVLTQAVSLPSRVFETVQLDICQNVGVQPDQGPRYNHILVAIDKFSRYTWLVPLKSLEAKETVMAFCREVLPMTGAGTTLEVDQGRAFASKDFVDTVHTHGLQLRFGDVDKHQAQSLAENRIKVVRKWIERLAAVNRASSWPDRLWQLMVQMRNQPFPTKEKGISELVTPHLVVFGRDMPRAYTRTLQPLVTQLQNPWTDCRESAAAKDAAATLAYLSMVHDRDTRRQKASQPSLPKLKVGTRVKIDTRRPQIGYKTQPHWEDGWIVTQVHPNIDPLGAWSYVVQRCSVESHVPDTCTCRTKIRTKKLSEGSVRAMLTGFEPARRSKPLTVGQLHLAHTQANNELAQRVEQVSADYSATRKQH